MHNLRVSALKPMLVYFVCILIFNLPASAQESAAEEEQLVQDTIVVEYKFPGPPLWKVTNGENELLIFGVIEPIPRSFEWDPVRLERALARADLYLSAPRSQIKLRNPIRSIRALRRLSRIKKNPDGGRLEEILPAHLYARYAAVRDTYAEDSGEIDRLTPLFAADTIYWGALDRAGLGNNREIYEIADRLARRSRVERERIRVREKRDPLTFVNDVRSVPMDEQIDCLSETLSLVESHMPSLLTRAEIWADGDVAPLATSAHPKLFVQACEAALQSGEQSSRINQLLNAKWLNTADEALKTHKTTVAILDIAEIIEPDGLVSELLDRGYVIEGPVRSSGSDTSAARAEEGKNLAPEATAAEAELSFREIPLLENAFIDTAPADRKDGISVGELGIDGGAVIAVVQLAKEIAEGQHGRYDSLLVSHKGKLLFESYYRRGRINLAHGQSSAAKAYTSLALGRAIQLGYLTMTDLDKPLISFFDELDREKLVEGAELITLRRALTMQGGLSVSEEKWEELQQNPDAINGGRHFIQALLEHSGPITAESQTFSYGNHNPPMVMAVIDAVAPGTAQDFIKTEILDKLGITNYLWSDHISGLPEAGWRVSLTSRDMLKLGSVVLNEGRWNGEQLVPAEYLAMATNGVVKPTTEWIPGSYRYGYFWYQIPLTVGENIYDTSFAWGGGGQRVIVIEDLDLTIVTTGHDGEDDTTIIARISEHILPTFIPQRNSTTHIAIDGKAQ